MTLQNNTTGLNEILQSVNALAPNGSLSTCDFTLSVYENVYETIVFYTYKVGDDIRSNMESDLSFSITQKLIQCIQDTVVTVVLYMDTTMGVYDVTTTNAELLDSFSIGTNSENINVFFLKPTGESADVAILTVYGGA